MKIIRPEEWVPCDGIVLEESADSAVRCSDNHVLVTAGPGAGKTELLAQKASYLLQTNQCRDPQKILAISFKTDAAKNLKERVEQRCGIDAKYRFVSMTYDAFAKSLLDHFLFALPENLRPDPNYLVNDEQVIDAAFRDCGYNNPERLSPARLKKQYETIIDCVNLPIAGNALPHRVWMLLVKGFGQNKSTLTFKMIMRLAIHIVNSNIYVKRALHQTYSYVFLDEFQDTTDLQYALVRKCFFDSSAKITAVGDNKQRIMIWAGAMRNAFSTFKRDLRPDSITLLMNHRSAPKLVALQQAMYASLNEYGAEVNISDKWPDASGDISLIIAGNEMLEAQTVVEDVLSRVSAGTKPSDICILCKQRPEDYVPHIISELEKQGIRARIETEYQDLIKEPVVDLILKFLICTQDGRHPHEWAYLEDTLVELWGIDAVQGADSYDQLLVQLSGKVADIKRAIQQKTNRSQWRSLLGEIVNFIDAVKIKTKYPEYKQGNYLRERLLQFEKLFWVELQKAQYNWQTAIENFNGEHSIPIMTIHKSKGLEYSAVYFVGLEDSAFWSFRTQSEQDRCAFFVALSRAKQSVTFTFCQRRTTIWNPNQTHNVINEFYTLLQQPGMANVIKV